MILFSLESNTFVLVNCFSILFHQVLCRCKLFNRKYFEDLWFHFLL